MREKKNIDATRSEASGDDWRARATLIVALDSICVAVSYALALLLRFDFIWSQIPIELLTNYQIIVAPMMAVAVAVLWRMRLYHSIWSFASINELMRLMVAWLAIALLLPLLALVPGMQMPISFWLAGGFLGFAGTTAIRFSYRIARVLRLRRGRHDFKRVMVVGAGESGRVIIREIKGNLNMGLQVVCAIDDNAGKWGRYLEGVPIVGGREDIASACEDYEVDQIIFAIPSCPGPTRKDILELCTATGLEVQAIPGMYQLVDGQVTVSKLRDVQLEDLLGRDPIVVDAAEVASFIEDRVVLVTGGGGSIGSELCRQIAKDRPRQLIIFDIYENNAYAIQQELRHDYPQLDLVTLIGSVRDEARVRSVFETYRPQLVFHAAAHWQNLSHPREIWSISLLLKPPDFFGNSP